MNPWTVSPDVVPLFFVLAFILTGCHSAFSCFYKSLSWVEREGCLGAPDQRHSSIAWGFYGVFSDIWSGSGSGLHEVSLSFKASIRDDTDTKYYEIS